MMVAQEHNGGDFGAFDDEILQRVEEGAELQASSHKSSKKSSKKKKKKKSSSKSSTSIKNNKAESSSLTKSNTTSITSAMSTEASGLDWPEEQEDAWKGGAWGNGSVAGASMTWGLGANPLPPVVPITTINKKPSAAPSMAEASLDPQAVFSNIDRRDREQSVASLQASRSSSGSNNYNNASRGSFAASRSSGSAGAAGSYCTPSSTMQGSGNLKKAPPNGNNNFSVEIPPEKWEAFDFDLEEMETAPAKKAPPAAASRFTEFPTDKWEEMSALESPAASPRNSLVPESTQKQAPTAPPAPADNPAMMGDTLINYLLSMGYNRAKAEAVAASFVAQQNQPGGGFNAAAAPPPPVKRKPAASASAAMANKLRELERPGSSTAHQRQVGGGGGRRSSSNSNASSLGPSQQSAARQPVSGSTDLGAPRGQSTATSTSNDSSTRPSSADGAPRRPQRRRRAPVPMYERFDRPGAVEMEGRAFGAPRRPATLTPPPKDYRSALEGGPADEEDVLAPNAPDSSENFVVQATTVVPSGEFADGDGNVVTAVVASPLSLGSALKERPIRRVVMCGLLAIVAIVAGVVSYFMIKDDGGGSGTAAIITEPTMAPSSSPTFIDDEVLDAAAKISGWEVLSDSASAQFEAVGWMSTSDRANEDNFGPSFLQRYSLVVFYFSTNGDDWINRESWLDPTMHECDWSEGIACDRDSTNRRVVSGLDATRNDLSGPLPNEIGNLRAVEHLRLSKNSIMGSLPTGLSALNRMSLLDLSANEITGPLPENIGNARDLVNLNLNANQINGTLPLSFYDLKLLRTLDLSWNQISGPLRDEARNLKVLATLNLRHNLFSGTITDALEDVRTLDFFWLDYNEFTGSVPALSANMGNRIEISLSHNNLSGAIPSVAGARSLQGDETNSDFAFRLQRVDVSYNQLTGTISPIAALLPTLRHFDISGNRFTSKFPGSTGWAGIEYLAGANNQFTGTLDIGMPQSLSHLDFGGNDLTGGVPLNLCDYPNLNFLDLGNNRQLNGTIPECLANLLKVRHLELSNSNLEGTLAPVFGLLIELETLDVSRNMLSSTIPTELGLCSNLKTLDLSHNNFVGTIPDEIGGLRFLKDLHVADNDLTGTLPASFVRLTKLEEFTMFETSVGGSIPFCNSVANLTKASLGCSIDRCNCCIFAGCEKFSG